MDSSQFTGLLIVSLAALVSLFGMVCAPLIKNAKAMVELNLSVKELNTNLIRLETNNTEAHKELRVELDNHDNKLNDHEIRIHDIERGIRI